MRELEVVRAEEEWQRAGAYSVRIQGMNRQHHISLREEFDERDGDGTKYIVLLDDGYPVATCRIYPIDEGCAKVGRVVVLPEYRGKHLGSKVIRHLRAQLINETDLHQRVFLITILHLDIVRDRHRHRASHILAGR